MQQHIPNNVYFEKGHEDQEPGYDPVLKTLISINDHLQKVILNQEKTNENLECLIQSTKKNGIDIFHGISKLYEESY